LGLQLSFLATLGLLVMVPQLSRGLDWLPTALIPMLTVPLAAFFWTLPLQLHNFGVVSPYTLLANLLTTPLISIISLGGVVSAGLAVISPIAGSATAGLLHYPAAGLIAIVEWFAQLPGSVMAVGTIPLWLMGVLYLMLGGLWWRPTWQRYGWALGLAGAALVFLPAWVLQTNLVQITALATSDQPVLIVQNRGQVGLVNSGQERTAQLTVLPFLRQQGVNRIDWALSLTKSPPEENGWAILSQQLPVRSLYHVSREAKTDRSQGLTPGQRFQRGSTLVEQVHANPSATRLQIGASQWLLLAPLPQSQQAELLLLPELEGNTILWWSGGRLRSELVQQIHPKIAIAYGRRLHPQTAAALQKQGSQVYWIQRDGAVQWSSRRGVRTMVGAELAAL
jgi:competence protein ComEC